MTALAMASVPSMSDTVVARLKHYVDVLQQWNPTINLVSPSTLKEAWQRHILDSAQLYPLLPPGTRHVVDLGTGAGFPGLVLAIMGIPRVTLVDSDQRKIAFLREVVRLTNVQGVEVVPRRIESLSSEHIGSVDVVTARALAPIAELLAYAAPFLAEQSQCLFLKGRAAFDEIRAAQKKWRFRSETFSSATDSQGVIVRLSECSRVPES